MNLKSTGHPASLRSYASLFQDIVAWFLAIPLAWALRYELQVGGVDFAPVLFLGIAAGALQFVFGSILRCVKNFGHSSFSFVVFYAAWVIKI